MSYDNFQHPRTAANHLLGYLHRRSPLVKSEFKCHPRCKNFPLKFLIFYLITFFCYQWAGGGGKSFVFFKIYSVLVFLAIFYKPISLFSRSKSDPPFILSFNWCKRLIFDYVMYNFWFFYIVIQKGKLLTILAP